MIARGSQEVPADSAARFRRLLSRRLAGEPAAYLLGEREFYGRTFRVDRRVLIPRPETEHLVEAVLALPLPREPRIADLGTGSGCLAVTLALELPGARIVATDLSPGALAVAAGNARRHGVAGRVAPLAADLLAPLPAAAFHLLVSNPPYVAREEAAALSPEVREFEPGLALFAGGGGLAVLERLLAAARELRPGAFLACEIGDGQLPDLLERLDRAALELVESRRDYAGKERVVVLRRRRAPGGPGV